MLNCGFQSRKNNTKQLISSKNSAKNNYFFSNTTFDTAQCYARDDFYAYDSFVIIN